MVKQPKNAFFCVLGRCIQMYFDPNVLKRGVGIVLDIMGAWRKLSHLYSAPTSLM